STGVSIQGGTSTSISATGNVLISAASGVASLTGSQGVTVSSSSGNSLLQSSGVATVMGSTGVSLQSSSGPITLSAQSSGARITLAGAIQYVGTTINNPLSTTQIID